MESLSAGLRGQARMARIAAAPSSGNRAAQTEGRRRAPPRLIYDIDLCVHHSQRELVCRFVERRPAARAAVVAANIGIHFIDMSCTGYSGRPRRWCFTTRRPSVSAGFLPIEESPRQVLSERQRQASPFAGRESHVPLQTPRHQRRGVRFYERVCGPPYVEL